MKNKHGNFFIFLIFSFYFSVKHCTRLSTPMNTGNRVLYTSVTFIDCMFRSSTLNLHIILL